MRMLPKAAQRQVAAVTAASGMPVSCEDGGIHEDDVGHRDEGGEAGEDFGAPVGAEPLEFEVPLQPIADGGQFRLQFGLVLARMSGVCPA